MANFQAQVEGLTGLSIGTSPSTTELTDFLKDGVIDALITLSKADPTAGKDDGKNNVGQLAREILTIILNEDV